MAIQLGACVLIGAGGTGSHLALPLFKYLTHHNLGTNYFTVIDGDTYEEKNLDRQLFRLKDLNKNKADALCDYLSEVGIFASSVTEYCNKQKFLLFLDSLPLEPPLVITAVDNMATRKEVLEALEESQRDYYFISPGNSLDTFTLNFYYKKDGKSKLPFPSTQIKNLKEPDDVIPGGCGAETPSTPQLIAANMLAASYTLSMVCNLLDEVEFSHLIEGSVRTLTANNLTPTFTLV